MEQISIFEFIDERECMTPEEKIFNDVLNHGANIQESLKRIKAAIDLPFDDFMQFLKHEFGIGGSSYTGYHTWWDGKGLKVGTDYDRMKLYSWKEVAEAFKKKYGGNVT